eukprot:gene28618-31788_t
MYRPAKAFIPILEQMLASSSTSTVAATSHSLRGVARRVAQEPVLHAWGTGAVPSCLALKTVAERVTQGPVKLAWGAGAAPFSLRGFSSETAGKKRQSSAAELGMYLTAAAITMIGLSYATVPIYRAFCAATGYGGWGTDPLGQTIEEKMRKRAECPDQKVEEAADKREVVVWFDAACADDMPWTFKPTQPYVKIKPGQSTLAFFTAENNSDQAITGYSLYSVSPVKASNYFNKIQCFCFEEQSACPAPVQEKEKVDMPVFFYVDPEFATDWNCRNVDDITLSYTFHKDVDDITLSYTFHKVDAEDEDEDEDHSGPSLVKVHTNQEHAHMLPASNASGAPITTQATAGTLAPHAMMDSRMELTPLESARRLGIPDAHSHDIVRMKCHSHVSATLRGELKLNLRIGSLEPIVAVLLEEPFFASLLAPSGQSALEAAGMLDIIKTVSNRLDGPSAEKDINPTEATALLSSMVIYVSGVIQAVIKLSGLNFFDNKDVEVNQAAALQEPWTGVRHALFPPLRKFLLVSPPGSWSLLAGTMLYTHCFMNRD